MLAIAGIVIKHNGMANKRFLERLSRIEKVGIIVSYPAKVTFPFRIKVR